MLTTLARYRRALRATVTSSTGSISAHCYSSLVSGGRSSSRSRHTTPSAAATDALPTYKNPFLHPHDRQAEQAVEPLFSLAPSYELYPDDVHCFLGLNGSGKTRFLNQLQHSVENQQQAQSGQQRRRCRISSLSLDAHREFVALHGDKAVANVLGGVGSSSARDLIVRLGLYPVWESHVKHLSTGEMRKLMLAETLLRIPRSNVLILDQPFDGLDVTARKQLEWMLGQLTRGFTRLLVDTGGRNAAKAYKTQVLLVANRLEQVFPEILTHMVLLRKSSSIEGSGGKDGVANDMEVEVLPCQVGEEQEEDREALFKKLQSFFDEEHEKRPQMSEREMVALVQELFDCPLQQEDEDVASHKMSSPAIELREVSIAYDDRRVLLDSIDFVRHRHEHWVLLGPNGSGKSSLMRVLMQTPGHGLTSGDVFVGSDNLSSAQQVVGAISTDQHLQLLHQSVLAEDVSNDTRTPTMTAFELILENAKSTAKAHLAAQLLNLPAADIQTRTLAELSQGEQKLVLIARTLAACPEVLILDEITHGLDPFNRAHVLRVVDAVGTFAQKATHLILITHHEDEITQCFTGVFEIRDKQLVERIPPA